MSKIKELIGRLILNSRGEQTVEATIILDDGTNAKASVPAGISTGKAEAKSISPTNAVENINHQIAPKIININIGQQAIIDKLLITLDGTKDKSRLGANAILATSLAAARAAAFFQKVPLYKYLQEISGSPENISGKLPMPLMVMIEGAKHAPGSKLTTQEYLVAANIENGQKIFNAIDLAPPYGLEGGYMGNFSQDNEVLDYLIEIIRKAGVELGSQANLALDLAASHFQEQEVDRLKYYQQLVEKYHLVLLEDPFPETQINDWQKLMKLFNNKIMIVGDDLFVTQTQKLQEGISQKLANAAIVKPNQVGTLTEVFQFVKMARQAGYKLVVSHRGNETTDDFITDLAVAIGAEYLKAGAPNPTKNERIVKYNRLEEISKETGWLI